MSFSALQRAENSSIVTYPASLPALRAFQCSSASRKFLNRPEHKPDNHQRDVSVLFSEPKIPQYGYDNRMRRLVAEFQCSSASRKFLNLTQNVKQNHLASECFSALQRAENSSIVIATLYVLVWLSRFSALQRAENSSMRAAGGARHADRRVSVLFSEPKIPQSGTGITRIRRKTQIVSVLFSEPKIPQSCAVSGKPQARRGFSALQRAENSSISIPNVASTSPSRFQCSSASRKFLNRTPLHRRSPVRHVSVLFSEPKIPQ